MNFLAANNLTQARIAETEKYAHVTFFFNGGVEEPNKGENRILVKSPKVATYDLQPEMSAEGVCDNLVEAIRSDKYDVIVINFANPDMVGHTGVQVQTMAMQNSLSTRLESHLQHIQQIQFHLYWLIMIQAIP